MRCDLRDGLLAALVIIVVALGARTAHLMGSHGEEIATLHRRLAHLREACPGTVAARSRESEAPETPWGLRQILEGSRDVVVLRAKVRVLGRAVATAVAGLRARHKGTGGLEGRA